jgi:adenylate kinase
MYLVLLGPPGTGKGTQAKLIAEKLDLAHVSTGDMFRDAIAAGTPLGTKAKAYMDRGELVPDEITIGMLEQRLREADAREGAIFDGFPRTTGQAAALDSMLARTGATIRAALYISASDGELIRRLAGRWVCPSCGEIYQAASRPPRQAGVCDKCQSKLTQRDDDSEAVIRERLIKQRPTEELLGHYREDAKLVEVDGEAPVDRVTAALLAAIDSSQPEPAAR